MNKLLDYYSIQFKGGDTGDKYKDEAEDVLRTKLFKHG